jgi:cobalt-zinc-cadmium efflux system membrane fusion protein
MKKNLFILAIITTLLSAQDITLTQEEEANWQIKIKEPSVSYSLPLGDFIAQVVIPPSLLHTISLPFVANVKQLYVAKYQKVKKGDILAKVTGTEWIAIQQKAISEAIEYQHHSHLTERKNMLCKEEIIPQKECIAANAELEADKIRVAASKALLRSYGASKKTIKNLFSTLKLETTIKIKSTIDGRLISIGAMPGKSINPSDAIFVILAKGDLWLESDMGANQTKFLKEGQTVQITFDNKTFNTTVLQISPIINPENQTQTVRFLIPKNINIVAGLRKNAKISYESKNLRIKKTSAIKNENDQIIFLKTSTGYKAIPIEIIAENDTYYFIKHIKGLKRGIATSSVAILKNMLGNSDE